MKKTQIIAFLCGASLLLAGCDVLKQAGGVLAMTQCSYAYNSVSNLSIAGIDLSKQLSATDLLKVTPLLTGKITSLPMKLTVGVDVTNPNATEALLEGLQYILSVDGVQFTTGEVKNPVSVPASSTGLMPLNLSFDLATLLSGPSKDATLNIVKNLMGIGNAKSKVKFEIKPSFKIGTQMMTAPRYIPLEFTL